MREPGSPGHRQQTVNCDWPREQWPRIHAVLLSTIVDPEQYQMHSPFRTKTPSISGRRPYQRHKRMGEKNKCFHMSAMQLSYFNLSSVVCRLSFLCMCLCTARGYRVLTQDILIISGHIAAQSTMRKHNARKSVQELENKQQFHARERN